MTELFRKYLELAFHPYNDRKRAIIESVPKELSAWHGEKAMKVRELLQTEAIESTTLVQTEYYNTVIEGSEPVKCWRGILPILPMKGPSMVIPKAPTGAYAEVVAEGADIPIRTRDYGGTTFVAEKYAECPMLSNELIADANIAAIEEEIKGCAERVENALNRRALSVILEASGQSYDTATTAANLGMKAIAQGIAKLMGAGFRADAVVLHPEAAAYVLSEGTPTVGNFASPELKAGLPGNLLGLKAGYCGVEDDSSTYIWDYDTNDDIGMLILASRQAGGIGMRQDLQVEEFEHPIKDLKGAKISMRFDVAYHQANAICRVGY